MTPSEGNSFIVDTNVCLAKGATPRTALCIKGRGKKLGHTTVEHFHETDMLVDLVLGEFIHQIKEKNFTN